MNNLHQNPNPSKPKTFRVPTPHHDLWLLVDLDGQKLTPLMSLAVALEIAPHSLIEQTGTKYWGTRRIERCIAGSYVSGVCLPVERFSSLLATIKPKHVPAHKQAIHQWLKTHGQSTLANFPIPEAPVPMLEEEPRTPARIQEVHFPPVPASAPAQQAQPVITASELIPIIPTQINGEAVNAVDGRGLHEFLEVGKDFSTWIKDRIEQYGFTEHQDFEIFDSPILGNQTGRGGDRRSKSYMLSLSMAKELAMVERNDKGKQARLYFIECERRAVASAHVQAFRVPTNLREALHLAAELEDKRMELECKVQAQDVTIATLEPKAAGLDRIALVSEGAHTITETAKILQHPPRKLFVRLQAEGWIYRQNGRWNAYQPKVSQGLMEHKYCTIQHDNGPEMDVAQPMITAKGIAKLATLLGAA